METSLQMFLRNYIGLVAASLIPVVTVAFLSIPYNLGGHPGAARTAEITTGQHMT